MKNRQTDICLAKLSSEVALPVLALYFHVSLVSFLSVPSKCPYFFECFFKNPSKQKGEGHIVTANGGCQIVVESFWIIYPAAAVLDFL